MLQEDIKPCCPVQKKAQEKEIQFLKKGPCTIASQVNFQELNPVDPSWNFQSELLSNQGT